MMIIDFSQKILDLDDKEIPIPAKEGEVVTLKSISVNALMHTKDGGFGAPKKDESGMDKVAKGRLAFRIHKAKKPIDLTSQEITQLISVIKEVHGSLVIIRALEMLDSGQLKDIMHILQPEEKEEEKK